MKAYEFLAQPTPEGKLELPETIFQILPTNQTVRVILLIDEPIDSTDSTEKTAWSQLTAEQLFSGYSEEDAIYDLWASI
jgi:ABC-type cobalamin transport system ATPase subunit